MGVVARETFRSFSLMHHSNSLLLIRINLDFGLGK